jgi:hypothetical protein
MQPFNPYLNWLGIPLDQQPPTFYRLLGIELNESNTEIIERAADRQMAYLRSLQMGDYAQAAQKLLNEVAAARLCLLDPQRRAAYDEGLAAQGISGTRASGVKKKLRTASALPIAKPMTEDRPIAAVAPLPGAEPEAPVSIITGRSPANHARVRVRQAGPPAWHSNPLVRVALGLGILAPVAVIFAMVINSLLSGSSGSNEVATSTNEAGTPAGAVTSPTPANNDSPDPTSQSDPPVSLVTQAADIEVMADCDVGVLVQGSKVLKNRPYAVSKLNPALAGMQFTQWSYGRLKDIQFETVDAGDVYLLLPPQEYRTALASNISLIGWEKTSLECEITVENGRKLPCVVLKSQPSAGTRGIAPATKTVWPILLAQKVSAKVPQPGVIAAADPTTPDRPEPTDDPETDNPGEAGGENSPPPTAANRLPLPAAAARTEIQNRLTTTYRLGSLASVEEKVRAARDLIALGQDPKMAADERFVALSEGIKVSADAGELARALETVDELEKTFDTQGLDTRLEAIRHFADATVSRAAKEQQLASVVPVFNQAIVAEKYDDVDEIVQKLFKARLNLPVIGEQRKRAIKLREMLVTDVQPAKKTLESNPDDPEANRIVGGYLCFGIHDWGKGLKMLAKGDDAKLKRVAQLELAPPARPEDELLIAETWRDAVEERVGAERGPLMIRAEEWFTKAYAGIPERDKPRAREQLGKLQEDMDKLKWPAPPRRVMFFASCGEAMNIAINGEIVLNAIGPGVFEFERTLNQGDIILVQAQRALPAVEGGVAQVVSPTTGVRGPRYSADPNRRKGFGCAILYYASTRRIVTGAVGSPWQSYITESAAAWEDPRFVRGFDAAMAGGTTGAQQDLIKQAGTPELRSIWGGTSSYECYLFCRIP